MAVTQRSDLPLTVAGRSPFDSVRIRIGGIGTSLIGVALMFGGAPGIVLGIPVIALGVATLVFSAMGAVNWYDIPTPKRYVVGVGAMSGFLVVLVFLAAAWAIGTAVRIFAGDR